MKGIIYICMILAAIAWPVASSAQQKASVNTGVQRTVNDVKTADAKNSSVDETRTMPTPDMEASLSEGDKQWMKVVYRELDLDKGSNAVLYYPEEIIDGQENLIRIILRLFTAGQIPAYEYLDGREIFTEQYKVGVKDALDKFYIPYAEGKGGKIVIDEADVPVADVMSYYIIERWTFDNRNSRMRTEVEAICPVMHQVGDFGGAPLKYPMFWIKYSDIRPYLSYHPIFSDDDNNMPSGTYADFFALNRYDGEIYKTRNLRNKSMGQLYPEPDKLKQAQDSVQRRLDTFEDMLWVPDREEVIAAREARDSIEASKSGSKVKTRKARNVGRSSSVKSTKVKSAKQTSGSAMRSVRRKK